MSQDIATAVIESITNNSRVTGSPDVKLLWVAEDTSRYRWSDVAAVIEELAAGGAVALLPESSEKTLKGSDWRVAIESGGSWMHSIRAL